MAAKKVLIPGIHCILELLCQDIFFWPGANFLFYEPCFLGYDIFLANHITVLQHVQLMEKSTVNHKSLTKFLNIKGLPNDIIKK